MPRPPRDADLSDAGVALAAGDIHEPLIGLIVGQDAGRFEDVTEQRRVRRPFILAVHAATLRAKCCVGADGTERQSVSVTLRRWLGRSGS